MKNIRIIKISILSFIIVSMYWTTCRRPVNYMEADGPKYLSNTHKSDRDNAQRRYTVASFNIEDGKHIKDAILMIKKSDVLQNLDVLLLQEMDESGTKQIADSLHMNYVYYPINNNAGSKRDFGNSILSRDSIFNESKIILPHGQSHNNRMRSVTVATTGPPGFEIELASVHLATVFLPTKKRKDQVSQLVRAFAERRKENQITIIGGDFNAITSSFRSHITNALGDVQFNHSSVGVGQTQGGKIPFLKSELDMIFSRNIKVIDRGKVESMGVSDHSLIWVEFQL